MARRTRNFETAGPNGIVLYHGPSAMDGAPIVVVLTGLAQRSDNEKTGGMLQTWIMRADRPPVDALRQGLDTTVCGDCAHRSRASGGTGACYVNVGQGPRAVWLCWKRGGYGAPVNALTVARIIAASTRALRIGSYGDPSAAPIDWRMLATAAREHTGYTHQWGKAIGAPLRGLCMASADSMAEAQRAWSDGWATFRVAPRGETLRVAGEARCPASAEAGKRVTCATCPIKCNGAKGRVVGRVIMAHGATAGSFAAA